jgi:bifunctional UDP-N-acetylglucosamine pyrophosphorylase/glucosamine-1-phosphate N-acetyltransferase
MILAAGKGTRMNSAKNKVLHTLLGVPMVAYPVESARRLGAATIVAVLGHQIEEVAKALDERFGPGCVTVVEQKAQKGTGHAVRLGLGPLADFDGLVVILYGDVPLLRAETLAALVAQAKKSRGLAMLTSVVPIPRATDASCATTRARFAKWSSTRTPTTPSAASPRSTPASTPAPAEFLRKATAKLSARNAQAEYYLTDIVAQAAASIGVASVDVSAEEMSGVNDRAQLVAAEKILAGRIVREHMKLATFRAPRRGRGRGLRDHRG